MKNFNGGGFHNYRGRYNSERHFLSSMIPKLQLAKLTTFKLRGSSKLPSEALLFIQPNSLHSFEFELSNMSRIDTVDCFDEDAIPSFLRRQQKLESVTLKNLFSPLLLDLERILNACSTKCKILDLGTMNEVYKDVFFKSLEKFDELQDLTFYMDKPRREYTLELGTLPNLKRLTFGGWSLDTDKSDMLLKILCNQKDSLEVLNLNYILRDDDPNWQFIGNEMNLQIFQCPQFNKSVLSEFCNSSIEFLVMTKKTECTLEFLEDEDFWQIFREKNPRFKSISTVGILDEKPLKG